MTEHLPMLFGVEIKKIWTMREFGLKHISFAFLKRLEHIEV